MHVVKASLAPWVGRRGRSAAILAVDRLAHVTQRFTGGPHRHHVTRDVEADRSGRRVAREGERAVAVEGLDVTVAVTLVPHSCAAAETRDVSQLLAVLDGISVEPADVGQARPGEVGKLALR